MKRKDAIRSHYEPRITGDGPGFHIVDWSSENSQLMRFQVLI